MSSFVELKTSSLSSSINLSGAELTLLTHRVSGEEYLWSGNPAIWSGIAPVLFPIIGELKNGTYRAKGQTYELGRHGFARLSIFEITEQLTDSVHLTLTSNSDSLAYYPWKFRLDVIFQLTESELKITYRVSNHDKETMLFNVGSHPAFRLPGVLSGRSAISDFAIHFNKSEDLASYRLVDNLLLPEQHTLTLDEGLIPLTAAIFENDALVFLDIQSDKISLVKTSGNRDSENNSSQPSSRVTIDTGGAPHLGIWAKPAAPYVCIEPWWGHADFHNASGELSEKASIQKLEPDRSFEHTISIEVAG